MVRFKGFLAGAFEALSVVGVFVVGGLAAATWWAPPASGSAPNPAAPALYLPGVESDPPYPESDPADPQVWLVDGYNAIGVGLLAGRSREGWWRSEHRRALLARAEAFAESGVEVWVVFDGAWPPDAPATGRVREVFAPDADAWLLGRAAAGATLVTADRRLAERAKRRGAEIVSPGSFLKQCPEPGVT